MVLIKIDMYRYMQAKMCTVYLQEHILQRKEKDHVTFYSGRGESRISQIYINGTSGQVVASMQVKALVNVATQQSS